jgi:hypothetical protein
MLKRITSNKKIKLNGLILFIKKITSLKTIFCFFSFPCKIRTKIKTLNQETKAKNKKLQDDKIKMELEKKKTHFACWFSLVVYGSKDYLQKQIMGGNTI